MRYSGPYLFLGSRVGFDPLSGWSDLCDRVSGQRKRRQRNGDHRIDFVDHCRHPDPDLLLSVCAWHDADVDETV